MTVVTGLAFDEWIDRHRAHHRFCQVEAHDPDMDVSHVIALTAASFENKGRLGKFMLRHQYLFIWPLSLFFGHSQRHLSQLGVFKKLRRYPMDALALILHFSLWFGVPCFVLNVSFSAALFSYIVPLFILGPHLAAIFWVNHIGMPLIKNMEEFSFFEHQYVTSRSISCSSGLHWFFGGLNFQIEHHLFPQVPSYRLRRVKLIVQRHFASRQIAYSEISWFQAVRAITLHLRALSRPGAS
jgi:fatty acid desaturase